MRKSHAPSWLKAALFSLLLSACFITSSNAFAQQQDENMEQMLDALEFDRHDEIGLKPLPTSEVDESALKAQWKLFQEVVTRGDSGETQLGALRDGATSIGTWNTIPKTFAAMAIIQEAHEKGQLDAPSASKGYDAAAKLSPNLPQPRMARAWHMLSTEPGRIGEVAVDVRQGWSAALEWPDTSVPIEFNLTLNLLIAAFLGALAFITGQLMRYFGVITYDFVRVLPTGFSSNQALIILLAILFVPGLLLRSPLLSLALVLLTLSLVQRPVERIVTFAIFLLFTALPTLETQLSDRITWSGSTSQELVRVQYERCDDACFASVKAKLEEAQNKDVLLEYAYWSLVYRRGDVEQLLSEDGLSREAVEKWPKSVRGYGLNLLAAAHISRADPSSSIDLLERAAPLLSTDPAVHLNLVRAHQMLDDEGSAEAAIDAANKISMTKTSSHLDLQRVDINSYLRVPPLPASLFWARHKQANQQKVEMLSKAWPFVAGPSIPFDAARYIGILGALLSLLSLPLSLKHTVSTPCPSCGLARDPNDGKETGDHAYCSTCYQVYIMGSNMEYAARVYTDDMQSRRRKIQEITTRVLSVLMPGAGHAMAGWAIAGFLISVLSGFALISLLRPFGIWRAPDSLLGSDWMGVGAVALVLGALAICAGLYGGMRGLRPVPVSFKKFGNQANTEHDHE